MKILLVVYDNDSYIHWFPQGLAYIAGTLVKHGYEVEIYNQDVHHYSNDHLTHYLDEKHFDVVGIGIIAGYYQYLQLLGISEAVNRSKHRPLYILGGHGPSPEPEFFLGKTEADLVVLGEGEETIIDLLDAIQKHRPLSTVPGIAYRSEGQVIINERRPLISDINTIPLPAYSLFPIDYYKLIRMPHNVNSDFVMPVLSGRGCTFNCAFCYRMDEGFRPRSSESIIEEIRLLKADYGITHVSFTDELLMSSVERTDQLCHDFMNAGLNVKWDCNGRLNYAKPDLLKLMRKAGCVFINYGIESLDDLVLKKMNKALSTKQIIKGVEATIAVGITPGLNVLFGNIGDTTETLRKGVEFTMKYDDGAYMRTIRPVTPYPGSPLYYHAIEKGLLKDCEDFYTNKHLNSDLIAVNFTELTDEEFYQALYEANSTLLTNYYHKKLESMIEQTRKLYFERDASFRGYRQT
ncbi:MAG: B12-binding domain-containing radical SAM protein [Proteobacteria bacterium]|nr:B12-binding domain-containing radical SAM protein [Pseudomonadota bacterium]MBU1688672.1 B12-binding domain-containing radical SAM protein [Pseudomonadota bacterium]